MSAYHKGKFMLEESIGVTVTIHLFPKRPPVHDHTKQVRLHRFLDRLQCSVQFKETPIRH